MNSAPSPFERSKRLYQKISSEHGHHVEINGNQMHYLEWGGDGGLPFIWLHGYTSTAFEMAMVGQQIADLGCRLYALTYRGHGQSQVIDYNFSLSDIADDVCAFMDLNGIDRAIVGGLSLGGAAATTFYENYPNRVIGLILEDGGADHVQTRLELHFEKLKPLLQSAPPDPFDEPYDDPEALFELIASNYRGDWGGEEVPDLVLTAFHDCLIRDEAGKWRLHVDSSKFWGDLPQSFDPARGFETPLLQQSVRRVHPLITYRNLHVPMLIIDPTGDDDGPWGSFTGVYQQLASAHPDLISLVSYPDTNHAAHPRRPDWFVRDVNSLIERVRTLHSDACPGR